MNWTYTVNGGGGYCSLDECIEMVFDHSTLSKYHSQEEIKEFCLVFGFFAFDQGVIFPVFSEGCSSIDFIDISLNN